MMTTRTIHATPQEVEALLAGRLTTFWRPVKPPLGPHDCINNLDEPHDISRAEGPLVEWFGKSAPNSCRIQFCPFGGPGDMLAIKEAWHVYAWHDGNPIIVEYRDGTLLEIDNPDEDWCERIIDQSCADINKAGWFVPTDRESYIPPSEHVDKTKTPTRWRSPVTMPRWAVRPDFTRPIVRVRVVRVQELDGYDAQEAGMFANCDADCCDGVTLRKFRDYWQSRYGTWAENPPAWGITIGGNDAPN